MIRLDESVMVEHTEAIFRPAPADPKGDADFFILERDLMKTLEQEYCCRFFPELKHFMHK